MTYAEDYLTIGETAWGARSTTDNSRPVVLVQLGTRYLRRLFEQRVELV